MNWKYKYGLLCALVALGTMALALLLMVIDMTLFPLREPIMPFIVWAPVIIVGFAGPGCLLLMSALLGEEEIGEGATL